MKNRFLLFARTAFTTTRVERQRQHDVCEVTLQQLEIGFLNEFYPEPILKPIFKKFYFRLIVVNAEHLVKPAFHNSEFHKPD